MTELLEIKQEEVCLQNQEENPKEIEQEELKVEEAKQEGKSFSVDKTAVIFGQSEEDIGKEYKAFKAAKLFKRVDVDLTAVRDNLLLKRKVEESVKYGFGNVVVNPKQIRYAKRFLKGRNVGVYAAVCYPYGEELFDVKRYAVKRAFKEGADGVYLPLSIVDLKSGKVEQIKRELIKTVRRYKRKKIFIVLELGELNFAHTEKIVKLLLKAKITGIVSGTGFSSQEKPFSGASDLHSLSSGKSAVVACTNTEKSRDVVSLFSVADRVFLKNAPKIALDLRANLEY